MLPHGRWSRGPGADFSGARAVGSWPQQLRVVGGRDTILEDGWEVDGPYVMPHEAGQPDR